MKKGLFLCYLFIAIAKLLTTKCLGMDSDKKTFFKLEVAFQVHGLPNEIAFIKALPSKEIIVADQKNYVLVLSENYKQKQSFDLREEERFATVDDVHKEDGLIVIFCGLNKYYLCDLCGSLKSKPRDKDTHIKPISLMREDLLEIPVESLAVCDGHYFTKLYDPESEESFTIQRSDDLYWEDEKLRNPTPTQIPTILAHSACGEKIYCAHDNGIVSVWKLKK